MDNKIKYKFLNYQTYQAFTDDLRDGKILDDSIVFIKDVRRIWARGTEYGLNTQVRVGDDFISILDPEGNVVLRVEFATKNELENLLSSAEYTGTDIVFKNKDGRIISLISATDFIKDGMVDEVELIDNDGTKALRIVFSTDSGKDEIVLDIGDLFNVDNYYTKNEVNAAHNTIASSITTERERAMAAEQSINSAVSELLTSKQNSLKPGRGITILPTDDTISVDDYIGERDINGKLQTLQLMLGNIYVLKKDVYKPEGGTWSEAPIYSFGDIPVSGGGETPTNSNIYALDESSFNVLELNDQLRNDVCYLITD